MQELVEMHHVESPPVQGLYPFVLLPSARVAALWASGVKSICIAGSDPAPGACVRHGSSSLTPHT